ncbi:MAG: hypothetical protein FJ109_08130 [Deltaproteobacteria bacterium]|nr:hypothetical protein [Deltaproteobacteria bacterium]
MRGRVDPRQMLLFGDSGNDVEMLARVGVGIAMGNRRAGGLSGSHVAHRRQRHRCNSRGH